MIEFIITEGNVISFEKNLKEEMTKSIKHFEHELVGIRTGRAHQSMVEDLKISCYAGESEMPLKNIAAISTPDARTIVMQPWDNTIISDIERAIKESDLGVTPFNDGSIIRISLPDMSSSRRDELIKILGKKLEDCKISIRAVRKNFQNLIRDTEKSKKISEDFAKRLDDLLQKSTDLFIKQSDQMSEKKNAELKP